MGFAGLNHEGTKTLRLMGFETLFFVGLIANP